MSKWLFSDFSNVFYDTINSIISVKETVITPIGDEWSTLGVHLIYDSSIDITDVENLFSNAINRRLQPIKFIVSSLYTYEGAITRELKAEKTDSRTVDVDRSSADEYQPMNSSIDEITSPTSKMKSVIGGTDVNKETGVDVFEKYKTLVESFDTVTDLIRHQLSPLIEEFNIMY